jgi:hypothetical protein
VEHGEDVVRRAGPNLGVAEEVRRRVGRHHGVRRCAWASAENAGVGGAPLGHWSRLDNSGPGVVGGCPRLRGSRGRRGSGVVAPASGRLLALLLAVVATLGRKEGGRRMRQ